MNDRRGVITKRMVGYALIGAGGLIVIAALAADLVGAGRFDGIGPAQRLAVLGGVLVAAVGVSLLPLGDRPA